MRGKTLFGDTDFFRAFPDPKDVFPKRVRRHAAALLPVGTLSLRHLSVAWRGKVHFVLPIEPCEDGRDFHFVGSVEIWNYLGDTNGTLLLFYDPEQQVALTTVDWS